MGYIDGIKITEAGLVNLDGTSKPHVFQASGEGAFCVCGWVWDSPEGNHLPDASSDTARHSRNEQDRIMEDEAQNSSGVASEPPLNAPGHIWIDKHDIPNVAERYAADPDYVHYVRAGFLTQLAEAATGLLSIMEDFQGNGVIAACENDCECPLQSTRSALAVFREMK